MLDVFTREAESTFSLDELFSVRVPEQPIDFNDFWRKAYEQVFLHSPELHIEKSTTSTGAWNIHDVSFESTSGFRIGGWLLMPKSAEPCRAFIIGHGYGGRDAPDFHLPFTDAALFFPCFRGISRSACASVSSNPEWHVLHDIDDKERYILRGCVEDVWLSVSCIEKLLPRVSGKIGYLGISFAGGVGALALAQDRRIERAHLNVPTFGHHRLRLHAATRGSGRAVQGFYKRAPAVALETLSYYDAASAAKSIEQPTHFALALKDPIVTPPGQFAIYNETVSPKQLLVLDEGHAHYKNQAKQHKQLMRELNDFFTY